MPTRIGTHHYVTVYDLKKAYPLDHEQAMEEGRVEVGPPKAKEGQRVYADMQGRYWVEDKE